MYSIVLPVLNEESNLRELLPQLFNPSCEVIVCDNGSTDNSVRLVRDAMPSFNVRLSQGSGTVTDAVVRGIKESRSEKVVVMDSDLSHPPEKVKILVSLLDDYELVVGSRYSLCSSSSDTPQNKLLSKLGNTIAFGLAPSLDDRMSGMFAIRRSLALVPIPRSTKPMLQFLVRSRIQTYTQVPIDFVPRKEGKSKLGRSIYTLLHTLWHVFILYLIKFQRPIKFLLVGGLGISINLGLLTLFTEVFHIWYVLSSFLAIVTTTVYSYLAHNYWTFERRKLI